MSGERPTFREKFRKKAYQRVIREERAEELDTPPVPHLDVSKAKIKPVTRSLAEKVILRYEWLGTMSPTRWHYGIFFGPFCAGVTCVGLGNIAGGPGMETMLGVKTSEILMLARGACVHWAPKGSNSKLVAWTIRLLKKDVPEAKVIIAYGDPDAGEIGTIYQATNWIYYGQTAGNLDVWEDPDGNLYHDRISWDIARKNGMRGPGSQVRVNEYLESQGWTRTKASRKYRYAYIPDDDDEKLAGRLEAMREPYPKRVRAEA